MITNVKTLKDTSNQYGLISKCFHWLTAIVVMGMFALGLWMVDLTYYDAWYKPAPHYHKSIGILLAIATLLRIVWRLINVHPTPLSNHSPFERRAARITHILIYCLLIAMFTSGYLISTIKGVGIEVFDWFVVPSVVQGEGTLSDLFGEIHEIIAWILIVLVSLHALAAIKHHLIDRDETLRRMTKR